MFGWCEHDLNPLSLFEALRLRWTACVLCHGTATSDLEIFILIIISTGRFVKPLWGIIEPPPRPQAFSDCSRVTCANERIARSPRSDIERTCSASRTEDQHRRGATSSEAAGSRPASRPPRAP